MTRRHDLTLAWREWTLVHRLASRAYWLGLIGGYGLEGGKRGWRLFGVRFRGHRPYVLGFDSTNWLPWHVVRYRHVPNNVGLGICGKCVPWPCCGSTSDEHADDCDEA